MNTKEYGFVTEEYNDGTTQRVLSTGDGKATFSDIDYENGDVGIAFSYGNKQCTGLNTEFKMPEGSTVSDIKNCELVVRFERIESIDAMVRCLRDVRRQFLKNVST